MNKSFFYLLSLILFCSACKQAMESRTNGPDSLAIKAINDSSLTNYLAVIAADSLDGRKPFTAGETKTINYLKTQFEKLGLKQAMAKAFFRKCPWWRLNPYLMKKWW